MVRHLVIFMCKFAMFGAVLAQPAEYIHPIPTPLVVPNFLPITAPGICLSNFDCPASSVCTSTNRFGVNRQCKKRLSEGESCTDETCGLGLVCAVMGSTSNRKCKPLAKDGGPCDNTCEAPFSCNSASTKCVAPNVGPVGSFCFNSNICASGLYCMKRKCTKKKQIGEPCFNTPDFYADECVGFCDVSLTPDSSGICTAKRKENEPCSRDEQCISVELGETDSDPFFCHKVLGVTEDGRCVRRSKIIKKLGAPCATRLDLCDSMRGMTCRRPRGKKQAVCSLGPSRSTRTFDNFCDPKSKFSRCVGTPFAHGRECRSFRFVPGRTDPGQDPPLEPRCLRRREVVKVGQSCEREFAACPADAECRVIAGIRHFNTLDFQGVEPDRAVYCVRPVGEGASCANKFETVCKDGLKCVDTKCRNTEENVEIRNTHAHINTECSELPCTPGLECKLVPGRKKKLCVVPVRTVGLNKPCEPAALFDRKCKAGLQCRLNAKNLGTLLCRRQGGVEA